MSHINASFKIITSNPYKGTRFHDLSLDHPENPMDIISIIHSLVKADGSRETKYQVKRISRGTMNEKDLLDLDNSMSRAIYEYKKSSKREISYYIS